MRAFISISLIAVICSLGSGLLEFVHNLAHAMEDTAEDRAIVEDIASTGNGQPQLLFDTNCPDAATRTANSEHRPDHHHDESNCPTHAQLHMAVASVAGSLPLALLGLHSVVNQEHIAQLIGIASLLRLDCRGPPTI